MSALTQKNPQIIGGMFALEDASASGGCRPPFMVGDEVLLANARSGFALLLQLLSPGRVWMPSYFCGHTLQLLGGLGTDVAYYGMDRNLSLSSLQWLERVRPDDLVVLVDYFGFPCDVACKRGVKERGAWLLEDACQALLSADVGELADFVLFSPRKFLGVPDGGVLAVRNGMPCDAIPLENPPAAWWSKAFAASGLRREFDLHGGGRHWFELFSEAEAEGPCGAFAMSELSAMLLKQCIDYETIAARRRKNYGILAGELAGVALFPELPAGVVPLGFPVRLKGRDRVRQALFSLGIYPPVHWPIRGVVPEEFADSHLLSGEIMTVPCDQRYCEDDMRRVASALLKEINE